MANSALRNNPFFNGQARDVPVPPAPSGYGQQYGVQQPGYGQQQYAPYSQPGQQQGYQQPMPPTPGQLDAQFQAPAATRDEMGRMSYEDVIAKTAGLFAVVLAAAAVAWFVPVLMLLGCVGGLVLGIVLAFKRKPAPVMTFAFAACEGLMVGGFSSVLEAQFAGIVAQAGIATFAVIAVTLVLFMNGKVRTSPKMNKIVLVALLGMAVFGLVNMVLFMTGVGQQMGMFGLHSLEVAGIPIGLALGAVAVFLGAYMLVSDFEFVQHGVQAGAPRSFGWIAGYALVSTVVYIYIEILRMIAIFRNN